MGVEGEAVTVVLFGATGDLARRMLLPSLYHLHRDGMLAPELRIVATGRDRMPLAEFATESLAALRTFVPAPHFDGEAARAFLERFAYVPVDAAKPKSFADLGAAILPGSAVVYYLSVSPSLYAPICEGLRKAGLVGPGARVALEKPIGRDLVSSREVNDAVGAVFDEQQIYRVDHYLGKETVQNLLALRFGNALFEPLWGAHLISQVQITVAETIGVEGRFGYYDGMGALRDMVQNHMLQLLALVAMEPPADLEPASVRNEKVKVLRSLRPVTAATVGDAAIAGQYVAGAVGGIAVPGYREEAAQEGLDPATETETFVALRAHIDNWRWSGVPFYLRTGKRMPYRYTEIFIEFKPAPHNIFNRTSALAPNTLVIGLQPEETIKLTVMTKSPGLDREGVRLRPAELDVSLGDDRASARRRIAYERLFLDLIAGNSTLFVRRDEIEAAWIWVDGVMESWRRSGVPPKRYPAGTWGPSAGLALPERFGHRWHE